MVTDLANVKPFPQKVYLPWGILVLPVRRKSVSLWNNKGMGATARAKSPRLRGLFFTLFSLFS